MRIGEHSPKSSADDIILEGAGLRVSRPIFDRRNPLPSIQNQEFTFRLHPDVGWNPPLTERDFMSILSNLTAIKIRGTYTTRGAEYSVVTLSCYLAYAKLIFERCWISG